MFGSSFLLQTLEKRGVEIHKVKQDFQSLVRFVAMFLHFTKKGWFKADSIVSSSSCEHATITVVRYRCLLPKSLLSTLFLYAFKLSLKHLFKILRNKKENLDACSNQKICWKKSLDPSITRNSREYFWCLK